MGSGWRELVAQRGLFEFSGGRAGDRRDELEAVRQLPFGEVAREVLTQLGRRSLGVGVQTYDRQRAFTPTVVGYGDDSGLRDGGMRHQVVLQVDRGDPLAAGLDEIL